MVRHLEYRRQVSPAGVDTPCGSAQGQAVPAEVIPGGAANNPMGVAAMTLTGGEYAIHGTNQPGSIGGQVSYGCIRMHNPDVLDLYGRVGCGTTVVVTQ